MIYIPFPIAGIMKLQGYDKVSVPWWVAIAACLVLVGTLSIWKLTIWAIRWWSSPVTSPKRLVQELCRVHALSSSEIQTIQSMAHSSGVCESLFFIDPELWKIAMEGDSADNGSAKSIFGKLFGSITTSASRTGNG